MHRRLIPFDGRPTARAVALAAVTAALALVPLASSAIASSAKSTPTLKLPAERTSPTGNFFTLEAYRPPTSSNPVANFEMKVCTSAHTPSDTAIEPLLFTLSLVHGGRVVESIAAARHPAIVPKPLRALECTEGWLGFSVPKGRAAAALVYDYNGKISWTVG